MKCSLVIISLFIFLSACSKKDEPASTPVTPSNPSIVGSWTASCVARSTSTNPAYTASVSFPTDQSGSAKVSVTLFADAACTKPNITEATDLTYKFGNANGANASSHGEIDFNINRIVDIPHTQDAMEDLQRSLRFADPSSRIGVSIDQAVDITDKNLPFRKRPGPYYSSYFFHEKKLYLSFYTVNAGDSPDKRDHSSNPLGPFKKN